MLQGSICSKRVFRFRLDNLKNLQPKDLSFWGDHTNAICCGLHHFLYKCAESELIFLYIAIDALTCILLPPFAHSVLPIDRMTDPDNLPPQKRVLTIRVHPPVEGRIFLRNFWFAAPERSKRTRCDVAADAFCQRLSLVPRKSHFPFGNDE